jgi:NitT/TauT family transport system ATP-binding protein
MAFLRVDKVKKDFYGERKEQVIALADLSFECKTEEFLCILGPTGCGKTTLLRLLAGLDQPDAGTISIDNSIITDINTEATLVFQQYSLFPWRSVLDNICFSLEIKGRTRKQRHEEGLKYVKLVGLTGFEKAFPYELSGGMQQRVAIARALAHNPRLLLFDEPFGALDERTRHNLQEKLLSIWEQEHKTILFVTHNIDEAIFLASRILIMKDRPGSIEDSVNVDIARPRNRRSKEFLELHIKIREIMERIISVP